MQTICGQLLARDMSNRITAAHIRKFGEHASDELSRQYRLFAFNTSSVPAKQKKWSLLCVVNKPVRDRFVLNGLEEQIFPADGTQLKITFAVLQGEYTVKVIRCETNASASNPYGNAALLEVEGSLFKPYNALLKNDTQFLSMQINY